MPPKSCFWVSSALLVVACAAPFAAHGQNSAGDTVYHLQGSVEDALTGKPLPRALVTSMDRRLATMTDSEGQFSLLISVPARPQGDSTSAMGRVTALSGPLSGFGSGESLLLSAKKPGYLQPQQPTILPLDSTLDSHPVELKLMPAGVIQGGVFTDTSDAPVNVRIMLLHRSVREGRYQWVQAGVENSDSRGQFRFDNLSPGQYTIMSAGWAGDQPLLRPGFEPTRQYPPLFLGDVGDLAEADKLQLHNGETLHAELHVRAATYYPITVPASLSGAEGGVNVRVLGEGGFNGFRLSFNMRDGAVEGTLPNGAYTLLVTQYGPKQLAWAVVPIHVAGGPLRTGPVTLGPGASIAVHMRTEFTKPQQTLERYPNILLLPEEQGTPVLNSHANSGNPDQITLENVSPGRYFVEVMPMFSSYVASMTSGDVNLLEQPLVMTAGVSPDPIEITLRDDVATLAGSITGFSGVPPRMCPVVLLPKDPWGRLLQGVAINGKFSIGGVPPGTYQLLAVPQVPQDIPYRDPEAMRAYAGIGSTVTLLTGQQAHADAPFADQIVPREP